MIGRLFYQDFLGLARKGYLRKNKQGLLGSRSQYQLVSLAVESLVKEEFMNGLSEFFKTFLVIIVVEEVVFPANQGFIDTESEIVIGAGMFVSDFDF